MSSTVGNIPVNIPSDIVGIKDVPGDIRIARYFTREKLEGLIAEQSIWFANADSFSDKKERSIPEGFFKKFKPEQKEFYQTLHKVQDENRKAYISCWTVFDDENYALWKIYDKGSNGACLVTTVGKLRAAIEKARPDAITVKVDYVDLKDRTKKYELPWITYNPDQNMSTVRMTEKFKQKPYKYEEEIRFIVYGTRNIEGFPVALDLTSLIDKIVISPFSNDKVASETRGILKKKFDEAIFCDSVIVDQ